MWRLIAAAQDTAMPQQMMPSDDSWSGIPEEVVQELQYASEQLELAVTRIEEQQPAAAANLISAAFFLRSAANSLDEAAYNLQHSDFT
jgi:hypothetical protein